MYLEHFGLKEPPFKITPVTEFFYSGANRGEMLNALIYAVSHSEGIIKVSGEVGCGKTMLCRMLLERLPTNIKAIYLANPSLTRDELLYAVADGLELDIEGQRVSVLIQNLQDNLVARHNRGEQCVVLVDEAHAMPSETLEELRLLYNLQIDKQKLIQIVLFGQPELNNKLEQNNMRQLKDRIVHHFNMQPISKKVIESYLMFRMRKAGYGGPDIFSSPAVSLISKASNGLMRRVNILADKSLLAAFVENTHRIESRHVLAAIRDSELTPDESGLNRKILAIIAGTTVSVFVIAIVVWILVKNDSVQKTMGDIPPVTEVQPLISAPSSVPVASPAMASQVMSAPTFTVVQPSSNIATVPALNTAKIPSLQTVTKAAPQKTNESKPTPNTLLQQRLDAAKEMLVHVNKHSFSLQLFFTQDTNPLRLEGFLSRAKNLGVLSDIYIVPIKVNGKPAFRALYGIYPNEDAARIGMNNLPQRYKDAFTPALNSLDSY